MLAMQICQKQLNMFSLGETKVLNLNEEKNVC